MREKKNIPTAQKTSFDVSWALFFVCLAPPSLFPPRPPVVLSPRCVVVLFGLVAALPLSCRFGHPFPPHEQWLVAAVLGGEGVAVSVVVVGLASVVTS
jgi:hypothetical protein